MKNIYMLICAVALVVSASAQENLLGNGGFEEYDCNVTGCAWTDWSMPFGIAEVESSDVIEGEAAMRTRGNLSGYMDNEVALSDDDYPINRVFRISLNYKILSIQEGTALSLDCYWEPKAGTTDAARMKKHDEEVLQRAFASSVSEGWENVTVETSKPENSARLRVRFHVPKKAQVLFDDLRVIETDSIVPGGDEPPTPQESDTTAQWTQEFVWDFSAPLTYMEEGFDRATHNQPIAVKGWQNIAAEDARPWWGFNSAKNQVFDYDFKSAKATAYQYGKETTGEWEMWLVTPALDYKNAENKIFSFSVMGQYLPEEITEEITTFFEVYYIDPLIEPAWFQDLTSSFTIPIVASEGEQWYQFALDLTPYSETIADVFYMAFRYVGPNGSKGVITYYLDDVSWGKEQAAQGVISDQKSEVRSQKILRDGNLIIVRDGKEFNVLGMKL